MFVAKVGDKVQRPLGYRGHGVVHTVTEVFRDGWFNHNNGLTTGDHLGTGGCHPQYWELVMPTTCRVTKHKEEYRAKIRPLNEAVHRANDPATSKGKRKVNKYEQAVLNALSQGGAVEGMTGKEIAAYHDLPLNCITPRFAPLRRKGLLKAKRDAMGQVEKRDKQIVWVLA